VPLGLTSQRRTGYFSETMTGNRYLYRVDATDRITSVSKDWLAFALENDAAHLTERLVLGSSVWDYVSGADVIRLYRELFLSVRARHAELEIPFNCDAPDLIRNMTLTLRSLPGGAIELESRVLTVVKRPPVLLLQHSVERSEQCVQICSLCRCLNLDGEWIPIGSALSLRRWLTALPVPRLQESLCSNCEMLAFSPVRPLN
jgi:hypothetical protein